MSWPHLANTFQQKELEFLENFTVTVIHNVVEEMGHHTLTPRNEPVSQTATAMSKVSGTDVFTLPIKQFS